MNALGCIIGLGAIIMFLAGLAASLNDSMNYVWMGGVGLIFCFLLLTRIEK